MKKKIILSPEEINNINLQKSLDEIYTYRISPNPTRKFEINEEVKFGGFEKSIVLENYNNEGLIYKLKIFSAKNRDKKLTEEERYVVWTSIFKIFDETNLIEFAKPYDVRVDFMQSSIDSLLFMTYKEKINFDVEYQREYVWELSDKVDLINSIFNNVDIGKITLAYLPFNEYKATGYNYEIIDGKQRVSTLVEFYEDRFKYNGKFFSELKFTDRMHFEGYPVSLGKLSDRYTKIDRMKVFVKLNTSGKVMSKTHLDKVIKMLEKTEG